MVRKVIRKNYRSKRVRSRSLKRRYLKKIKMLRGGSDVLKTYTIYQREFVLMRMYDSARIHMIGDMDSPIYTEFMNGQQMAYKRMKTADERLAANVGVLNESESGVLFEQFRQIDEKLEGELEKFYSMNIDDKTELLTNFENDTRILNEKHL